MNQKLLAGFLLSVLVFSLLPSLIPLDTKLPLISQATTPSISQGKACKLTTDGGSCVTGGAVTAGNLIILGITYRIQDATMTGVQLVNIPTDNKGTIYTEQTSYSYFSGTATKYSVQAVFYTGVVSSSGALNVSVTLQRWKAGNTPWYIFIVELGSYAGYEFSVTSTTGNASCYNTSTCTDVGTNIHGYVPSITPPAGDLVLAVSFSDSASAFPTLAGWTSVAPCAGCTSKLEYRENYPGSTPITDLGVVAVPMTGWAIAVLDLTLGPDVVTQPIKVTMANGAPSSTVTVTGCAPTPSILLADGFVHNIILNDTCSFYLTFPSTGGYRAGVIVPLYSDPASADWTTVRTLATSYTVPIVTIVNPNNGPGGALNATYATAINNLKSSGITVLGYVYTTYGTRALANVETDVTNWYTWYSNIDGIFADEFDNVGSAANETYYSNLAAFIRGLDADATLIGNPGAAPHSSYLAAAGGTWDVQVDYENSGLPTLSYLAGQASSLGASRLAYIAYNVAALNATFENQSASYVKYLYITSLNLPNPFSSLPSYFSNLVANLSSSSSSGSYRYGFSNTGFKIYSANHTSSTTEWDVTAYLQTNFTVKYAVNMGAPTAPTLTGQYLGAANATTLQIPAYTTRWLDWGAAWSVTNPITVGFEAWTSSNTTSGTNTAAKTGTFYYVHSWLNFVFHVKFTKPDSNPWAATVPYFTFFDGLLGANRTVALSTSYATYNGRNNTAWNTTNPFFFDAKYWVPDTPTGTLTANNTYINITYNSTSSCGTDPFVDLISGCWWGTVIYTISPVMGNFGLGLIIMSISLALYLKSENPLIPIIIMIAAGGVLGGAVVTKVLPDFYFPLTAIFLTLGISGGVYQLVRNR